MKSDQHNQVEFIKDCLRKGEERKIILPKFTTIYRKSEKTFNNRLKEARKSIQGEQQRIQQEAEKGIQKDIIERKSKIMTSIERQEFLTEIAKGEEMQVKELLKNGKIAIGKIIPNLTDRLKAIAELNKMQGDYAPTKSEISVTEKPKIIFPGDEPTDD